MARSYFQTERQELEQQEALRAECGRQLRASYASLVLERLPDHLAALIDRLAEKPK